MTLFSKIPAYAALVFSAFAFGIIANTALTSLQMRSIAQLENNITLEDMHVSAEIYYAADPNLRQYLTLTKEAIHDPESKKSTNIISDVVQDFASSMIFSCSTVLNDIFEE